MDVSEFELLKKRVAILEEELVEEKRRRRIAESDISTISVFLRSNFQFWMTDISNRLKVNETKPFEMLGSNLGGLSQFEKELLWGRYELQDQPKKRLKQDAKSHVPK